MMNNETTDHSGCREAEAEYSCYEFDAYLIEVMQEHRCDHHDYHEHEVKTELDAQY